MNVTHMICSNLGSAPARPAITCNTLKSMGVSSSGIYSLHEENQEPRLGYCDMSINDSPMPNPRSVAFFAYKQAPIHNDVPEYFRFMGAATFEILVENIGGGMDIRTGTFTAPQAGLYLLSYSSDSEAMVGIKKNGHEEFDLHRRHSNGGLDDSYTWLSHLEIGDKIYLEVVRGQIKTFNGYLVK